MSGLLALSRTVTAMITPVVNSGKPINEMKNTTSRKSITPR